MGSTVNHTVTLVVPGQGNGGDGRLEKEAAGCSFALTRPHLSFMSLFLLGLNIVSPGLTVTPVFSALKRGYEWCLPPRVVIQVK